MQKRDVEQILFAGLANQFSQGADLVLPTAQDQALVHDGMPGGRCAKFVSFILIPGKSLENAPVKEREAGPFEAGEIARKREGFQPRGIIRQREMFRKDLMPQVFFGQAGEAALERAAVETNPVEDIDHFGHRNRAEDNIVTAKRNLLGGVVLVALKQESQFGPNRCWVQVSLFLGRLLGGHFPLQGGMRKHQVDLRIGGFEIKSLG